MLQKILHTTAYAYSRPVFLEPHTIRLRPRADGAQRLVRHVLTISPKPAGQTDHLDTEFNLVTSSWFEGLTPTLSVIMEAEVETYRSNPFDFILSNPNDAVLPIHYKDENALLLKPYTQPATTGNEGVAELVDDILRSVGGRTVDFLMHMSRYIFETVKPLEREKGPALTPAETLAQKKGACRDHAVLYIEACRTVGLATRFVSGYLAEENVRQTTLHAWAEIYLPGGGWRGFDPSTGLAINDRYVALASSRLPSRTAPVSGTYRGTDVTVDLKTSIQLEFE